MSNVLVFDRNRVRRQVYEEAVMAWRQWRLATRAYERAIMDMHEDYIGADATLVQAMDAENETKKRAFRKLNALAFPCWGDEPNDVTQGAATDKWGDPELRPDPRKTVFVRTIKVTKGGLPPGSPVVLRDE